MLQTPIPDSSETGETGMKIATGRDRAYTSRESRSSRLLAHQLLLCLYPRRRNELAIDLAIEGEDAAGEPRTMRKQAMNSPA
jgi:hypothetical protein